MKSPKPLPQVHWKTKVPATTAKITALSTLRNTWISGHTLVDMRNTAVMTHPPAQLSTNTDQHQQITRATKCTMVKFRLNLSVIAEMSQVEVSPLASADPN